MWLGNGMPTHGIVLPWETGFVGLVLGPRRGGLPGERMTPIQLVPLPPLQWVGPVLPPFVPAPIEKPSTSSAAQTAGLSKRQRAAGDGRVPEEARTIQRKLAVGKWQVIVQAAAHCCAKDLIDPAADAADHRRGLKTCFASGRQRR